MTSRVGTHRTSDALRSIVGDYEIDPTHTRLGFSIRYAMSARVRGSFTGFTGAAHIDEEVTRSTARIVARADTFTTGVEARDTHTKSADLLDVEAHPEITFASTSVVLVGETTFRITGELTVHGVTRPVTVDFEFLGLSTDHFGNVRAGFSGATTIARSDFGISFSIALDTGGVLISDKVELEFEVSAVKQ